VLSPSCWGRRAGAAVDPALSLIPTTSTVDHAKSNRPSALVALTNGGLAAVTRSLAIEYASRGVRINAVSPGIIKTPMHDAASYQGLAVPSPPGPVGMGRRRRGRNPLPRTRLVRHRRDRAHRRRTSRRRLTQSDTLPL